MTPASKKKPVVKVSKPPTKSKPSAKKAQVKKNNVVEEKLNEMIEEPKTAKFSAASKKKNNGFSWWAVLALLLVVIFGAVLLYENNTDFRHNSNKLLNSVGLTNLPTEGGGPEVAKAQDAFEIKMTIVYDKDHPVMKTSIEAYLKNLETNLENTKVSPVWLDRNDAAGQELIAKLNAKFLPLFTTDASIVKHPQYSLFSGVIQQNNGEYQLASDGMVYLEIPTIGEARYIGANPTTAKVVIIEYASPTCGYCKAMHTIVEKTVDTYGPQVSWVIKHYDRGGIDSLLSQSIECAADQNRIRPMVSQIYQKQADFFSAMQTAEDPEKAVYDMISQAANEAGANGTRVVACVKAGTYAEKISEDSKQGVSFGVMGTPAYFINNTFLGGATDEATFIKLVDEAIKQ